MAKNIMPDIAELLGVEINEEFKIYNTKTGEIANNTACILDNKIVARRPTDLIGVWHTLDAEDLNKILNGEYSIVRKPYAPKTDEEYWTYSGVNWKVVPSVWCNMAGDYALLKAGCVFRTKEEAEQNLPRKIQELKNEV